MSLYFTKPIARTAIWGGDRLATEFGYRSMTDRIGQCWAFSCQDGNESPLEGGGTLGDLWRKHPEFFQSRYERFPFIISLVAPVDDLSIQIHPNDAIAKLHAYPSGKNEAWVFLKAPNCGSIVYGQHTHNEKELREAIARDEWEHIISHLPVQQDDFVYVPAGMLHALSAGCVAYEIQQATDVTYRFYDYHRKDSFGRERPLHVQEAVSCVDFTLGDKNATPHSQCIETLGISITTYTQCDSFCIRRFDVHGKTQLSFPLYQLMTVIDGAGIANGFKVQKGSNFLLPANATLNVEGTFTVMATCE